MTINFISSKNDSVETRPMCTKSNNVEIMIDSETDEVIEDLFDSFLQRYQEELEESMKRSEFIFDSVDASYCDFNKISLNTGGSYIDSPKWLKNKKTTKNPQNKGDRCFQYAFTNALNCQNIKNNQERISKKLKLFIDQYNRREISFPSHKEDWKKFELNNKSITLIFYMFLTILKK